MSSPHVNTPDAPRRDPALDGLRGVAVLLVFLFHYGGGLRSKDPAVRALGYLTQAGWVGVEIFFALSGFLITSLLLENLKRPGSLRNFYARRALRILPLYAVALLASAGAGRLAGCSFAQLRPLLVYAGFLQNMPHLVQVALRTPPPLPLHHLWSLAVEEQFYLLWPLLLLPLRSRQAAWWLCAGVFALCAGFRLLLFAPGLFAFGTLQTYATVLPVRMGALALGGALAASPRSTAPFGPERTRQAGDPSTWTAWLLFVFGLAIFGVNGVQHGGFLMNNRDAFRFGLAGTDLLSAGVVALALRSDGWRRVLRVAPLAGLGRISYGFYVLHILCEPAFDRLGALLTHQHQGFAYQAVRLLCAFPLTVTAAWMSAVFLERPFLRLRRRFPERHAGLPS